MSVNSNPTFSATDYVVFVSLLVASLAIGVYYGFISKRKQNTTTEYLLGGKQMKTLPVAFSLIATSISGFSLIAIPSEIYSQGPAYLMVFVGIIVHAFGTWYIYLPVFIDLQLGSAFEYLEKRFDHSVRVIASIFYTVYILLYVPVTVYIPALAFQQATGISIHYVTPVACLICMFYTSFGGVRAVVWTDTLQFLSMMSGIFLMISLGLKSVGLTEVFEAGLRGQRLKMDMDPSPFLRTTFWTMVLGNPFNWLTINPAVVQRYLSLPNKSAVRNALICMIIGVTIIMYSNSFIGLLIYANYESCDPLTSGRIEKIDQIVPYFLMDLMEKYPGIPGLFVAAIFSAALSTMSSGWNTLAGTIYEDFIRPVRPNASEKWGSNTMKLIVLVLGFITLGLVFVVEKLGSVFALIMSVTGITAGVFFGMFTFGMLCRNGNAKGVKVGSITAFLFLATICVGSQFSNKDSKTLPFRTDGCPNYPNNTLISNPLEIIAEDASKELGLKVFDISFLYYVLIAVVIVCSVGSVVSYFTGGYSPQNEMVFTPFRRKKANDKTTGFSRSSGKSTQVAPDLKTQYKPVSLVEVES